MTVNTYNPGDRIDIDTSTVFQDKDEVAFDPDVTTFIVEDPDGTQTTYVYDYDGSQDSHITRNGTGDYTLTIDVDTAGKWIYHIDGEQDNGDNRGADEGIFFVRGSKLS